MEEFNLFDILDQLDNEEEETPMPAAAQPAPVASEPEPEETDPESDEEEEPEQAEETEEEAEEDEDVGQGALFPEEKPAPAKKPAEKNAADALIGCDAAGLAF